MKGKSRLHRWDNGNPGATIGAVNSSARVAAARFTLRRPDPADPAVEVEVALIRDWRKRLSVERANEVTDDGEWLADLTDPQTHFWEESWQAVPAPAVPT